MDCNTSAVSFHFVTDGPENLRINPSLHEYEVTENQSFGPVTCQADCLPNCTYEWSKNVSIVSSTAVLSMPTVLNSNAGVYVCTSTHANGYTASINIGLNIICELPYLFVKHKMY